MTRKVGRDFLSLPGLDSRARRSIEGCSFWRSKVRRFYANQPRDEGSQIFQPTVLSSTSLNVWKAFGLHVVRESVRSQNFDVFVPRGLRILETLHVKS